jgi:hypothetical protein
MNVVKLAKKLKLKQQKIPIIEKNLNLIHSFDGIIYNSSKKYNRLSTDNWKIYLSDKKQISK